MLQTIGYLCVVLCMCILWFVLYLDAPLDEELISVRALVFDLALLTCQKKV